MIDRRIYPRRQLMVKVMISSACSRLYRRAPVGRTRGPEVQRNDQYNEYSKLHHNSSSDANSICNRNKKRLPDFMLLM